MQQHQVLNALKRANDAKYVEFDPADPEHLKAYASLAYAGRQLPHLRFFLSEGYSDVVSMMRDKITRQYLANFSLDIPELYREAA